MTRSSLWSMAAAAAALLTLASCKKASAPSSDNQVASLLFDVASPAAREALATPVDFRLTDENYAQWERAQRFLDALPHSAFAQATTGGSANPIDRAVEALEASPRARTAIERTGLSVRDFVLETVALAQAAEAETGKAAAGVSVPAENLQFIQRYRSRILQARTEARATSPPSDTYILIDTTSIGAETSVDVAPAVERGADIRVSDSASVGERARNSDSVRRDGQSDDRLRHPPADTARDTIPAPIISVTGPGRVEL
jgi:hypothetical protein